MHPPPVRSSREPRTTTGRSALALLLLTACGDRTLGDTDPAASPASTSGATTGTPTTGSPTTGAPTTGAPTTETSTTGAATTDDITGASTTGTGESGASSGCEFACMPDLPPRGECDPYQQDCPEGQKCTATSYSEWYDTNICVAIYRDPKPPGALCEIVELPWSGINDCEEGAFCFFFDLDGKGVCVPMCGGTIEDPVCPEEHACLVMDALNLCVPPACDPLVQDCGSGKACVWSPTGLSMPVCLAPPSGDQGPLEPCDPVKSECAVGLVCASSDLVSAQCEGGESCCTPYCDIDQPADCPDPAQICRPFEGPWPGLDHLGACALP